jgi:hypothetical protein
MRKTSSIILQMPNRDGNQCRGNLLRSDFSPGLARPNIAPKHNRRHNGAE